MTISGNTAGPGADNDGGGIFFNGNQDSVTITLNNVTITDNTADDGGGLYVNGGTVAYKNTIIIGNTLTGGTSDDCATFLGELTNNGYNLLGTGTGCIVSGTDVAPQSPITLDLSATLTIANGGPTATHMLPVGSGAIEGGDTAGTGGTATGGCLHSDASTNINVDQRGGARAQGTDQGDNACDIGAVEGDATQTPSALTMRTLDARSGVGAYAGVWMALLVMGVSGGLTLLTLRWRRR